MPDRNQDICGIPNTATWTAALAYNMTIGPGNQGRTESQQRSEQGRKHNALDPRGHQAKDIHHEQLQPGP